MIPLHFAFTTAVRVVHAVNQELGDPAAKALDGDPLLRVKLLVLLEGFEGWERHPDWGDLSFYSEHGDRITRIAIVGDPKWETEFKMFAGAGFRRAPVQFFPSDQLQQANLWLAE